jgi:predicted Zn-ribbon and HTH transcriptional regulator
MNYDYRTTPQFDKEIAKLKKGKSNRLKGKGLNSKQVTIPNMARIQIPAFQCERCEHIWAPRRESQGEPKVCPKCKSPYWNRPRGKIKHQSIVNLYPMFGVSKLRFRESAEEVVESLPKGDSPVVIDFYNIEFASPSFLQELLSGLGGRKVTFENVPEFVQGLIEIFQKKMAPVSA